MKSLSVFLLSIIFFKASYSQSEWKWIAPYPPNKMVYSSVVVDNKAFFWCEYTSVIKLDFETENFEVLPSYAPCENCGPVDFAAQGLGFADSLNGYVTDVCYGEFRTTDGGLTWTTPANSGGNISLVVFGSSRIGWKLGFGGFYRTSDAGETWNQTNVPNGGWGDGGVFSRMYALNQNQLWVLKKSYNGIGGNVWYSSNSGNNWSCLNTGLISDSLNQVSYFDVKMDSSGIGYIVGSIYKTSNHNYEGFILKTTDMGVTWSTAQYSTERFEAILLLNVNEAVVFGNKGDMYLNNIAIQRKTTDAGNSWMFSSPLSSYLTNSNFYDALYAPSKDAIYMFATFGFYKSTDRGATYQKVTSEMDVAVSEIVFDSKPINSDSQLGVAWLKWKTRPYLITYDGGRIWHKKSLPQSMGYIWLVAIAEEVIYMITDQKKLYKSTDFGESWNQLNVPLYYSGLQALSVYNKDVLVLHAYQNLVSTTDGGISWILGPMLDNARLEKTDISELGHIVGVGTYYDSLGEKGCFFNSSNYGLSWHIFDTENKMKDVTMVDEQIGFALGEKKLYKTMDGAQSWKTILSRGSNWYEGYSCFAFRDSLKGIVDSDEGMKMTTDGGKYWIKKDYWIPFPGNDKMEYNARGDLFMIAGASIIILPSNQNFSPNVKNTSNESVSEYYLFSSFPNPFNSASTIKYYIPLTSQVTIKIFNTLGEEIETLVDEIKTTGTHEVTWNAGNLPSGVYFYRLQSGSFVQTKKMILLK